MKIIYIENKLSEELFSMTNSGQDTYRTHKSRGRCDDKDNNKNMQQYMENRKMPKDWKESTSILKKEMQEVAITTGQ